MKYWTATALVVALALLVAACEDDAGPASVPPRTTAVAEPSAETPAVEAVPSTPEATSTRPVPTEPSPTQAEASATYTVKPGDVCWRIAEDHGVTTRQLLDANPRIDSDCRNLGVGWELVIPGAVAAGTVATSTSGATPVSTPQATPPPTPRNVSTPVATAAPEGYWHEHCARIRNDGGCDRRFRPIRYDRHYHPASVPSHREGEHEVD